MSLIGKRTLVFGLASLGGLLYGFSLVPPDGRGGAFVFLAGGIGAVMAAVAGKSAVSALAQGGGVRGAAAALMTDAKPSTPTTP